MAEPRISSIDGKLAEEFAVPSHVEEVKEKMAAFAERHVAEGRRVVLITSGGTKVPLESRTVRFLDNFSSGRRGASSAEYFMNSGYAVIFLHRHRSLYPYTRMFSTINMLDVLQFTGDRESGEVVVNQQVLPNVAKALKRYQEVKEGRLLLPVEFNTLSDYLHLLKAAAQALSGIGSKMMPCTCKCCESLCFYFVWVFFAHSLFVLLLGSKAMFYLAAAVSDFYIPASEMPEHKIQSSNGPLQLSMKMVPKILSPLVKDWAPQAFVISFKLETDASILLDKARRALDAYRHQVVVANVLDSRRGYVMVVTRDTQDELVLTEDDVKKEVEIEERIVNNLTSAHAQFIAQQLG
ncbi:phosphopantothenate--cysteine ligase isoform 1-T4 [Aulostomus maculatus]